MFRRKAKAPPLDVRAPIRDALIRELQSLQGKPIPPELLAACVREAMHLKFLPFFPKRSLADRFIDTFTNFVGAFTDIVADFPGVFFVALMTMLGAIAVAPALCTAPKTTSSTSPTSNVGDPVYTNFYGTCDDLWERERAEIQEHMTCSEDHYHEDPSTFLIAGTACGSEK